MNNTIKKITRKGAGRTLGSFSFVRMSVKKMLETNPNQDFEWLVSRKQSEALGISGLTTGTIGELKESLAGTSEETKAKVVTVEL